MGSCVAYFLKRLAPTLSVAVVEGDKTYEFASTLRASGGTRRQFSCPENIEMSNFSIPFMTRAHEELALDGEPAHVDWHQRGSLFIVPESANSILRRNYEIQRAHGVKVDILERDGLRERFRSMNLEGIAAGVRSLEDGWCDPNEAVQKPGY